MTYVCNKPVQAAKEMAGVGLTKNWCGYKNNKLAVAHRPNQQLMVAFEGSTKG